MTKTRSITRVPLWIVYLDSAQKTGAIYHEPNSDASPQTHEESPSETKNIRVTYREKQWK